MWVCVVRHEFEGGAAARGEQLATLNVLAHETITAPAVADTLAAAAAAVGDDPWRAANLREMKRRHVHAAALPAALVAALARAEAACETVWRTAREASDFTAVAPLLEALAGAGKSLIQLDLGALAAKAGGYANAVLLGAIAGTELLPLESDHFRAAIEAGCDVLAHPGLITPQAVALAAEAGIPVRRVRLPLSQRSHWDEAFLTSTSRHVLPLVRLDGAAIGVGAPGPVTRGLQGRFETHFAQVVGRRYGIS